MDPNIGLAVVTTRDGRPEWTQGRDASPASGPARVSPDARAAMLNAMPHLRAFAISLTGSVDQADDLVQEALVRGLSHIDSFQPGTSMQAWLFTILRNQFHTSFRRRRREVEDPDGVLAGTLFCAPEQDGHLDLQDMRTALAKLPVDQREALLLVSAEGFSYEEAAAVCGAKVGTIKSRINRARARLAELLGHNENESIGVDSDVRASEPLRGADRVLQQN
jgi:RNA polymerase sigma-70 factor, ECF subfamily